ncbi:acyl-CoA dehydrogenase family protein, partial [Peribacillus sp. NPDC060186]
VTIGNHQAVQMMLADCAMDIYAARNMLLHCAWKMENQEKLPLKEISMIKAYCTEMAQRVVDRSMQIHGGMGLTNELKLEKVWRWARSMRIPDGTTQIQKRTIARRLLKGDRNFS